jgi:hypothetical protein
MGAEDDDDEEENRRQGKIDELIEFDETRIDAGVVNDGDATRRTVTAGDNGVNPRTTEAVNVK